MLSLSLTPVVSTLKVTSKLASQVSNSITVLVVEIALTGHKAVSPARNLKFNTHVHVSYMDY